MDHPNITLRYFNARGRAQFIRYYLLVRNVDFEDARIAIDNDFSEWIGIREDDDLSGPFHKLPVLHWGDDIVAETPVIATYLHRKLGDEALLSERDNLRHDMLRSSLHVDLMMPLGILLWADILFEGVDIGSLARNMLARIRGHLNLLDKRLSLWQWLDSMQGRPLMLADCLLWEEIDAAQAVFGPAIGLRTLPTLETFHERYRSGTAFARLLDTMPCQITARPNEAGAIEIIRESVVSAGSNET